MSAGSFTVDRGGVWNARIAHKRQHRASARLPQAAVGYAVKCGNATIFHASVNSIGGQRDHG
jgi:hypothetical protein